MSNDFKPGDRVRRKGPASINGLPKQVSEVRELGALRFPNDPNEYCPDYFVEA